MTVEQPNPNANENAPLFDVRGANEQALRLEEQFRAIHESRQETVHEMRSYKRYHRMVGVRYAFGFAGVLVAMVLALTVGASWGYAQPGAAMVTFVGMIAAGFAMGFALWKLVSASYRSFAIAGATLPVPPLADDDFNEIGTESMLDYLDFNLDQVVEQWKNEMPAATTSLRRSVFRSLRRRR